MVDGEASIRRSRFARNEIPSRQLCSSASWTFCWNNKFHQTAKANLIAETYSGKSKNDERAKGKVFLSSKFDSDEIILTFHFKNFSISIFHLHRASKVHQQTILLRCCGESKILLAAGVVAIFQFSHVNFIFHQRFVFCAAPQVLQRQTVTVLIIKFVCKLRSGWLCNADANQSRIHFSQWKDDMLMGNATKSKFTVADDDVRFVALWLGMLGSHPKLFVHPAEIKRKASFFSKAIRDEDEKDGWDGCWG